MDTNDRLKLGQDERALWERPAIRHLATKYAEGAGLFRSEGVPGGGQDCVAGTDHSCKGA
jgi:hypothetical protein